MKTRSLIQCFIVIIIVLISTLLSIWFWQNQVVVVTEPVKEIEYPVHVKALVKANYTPVIGVYGRVSVPQSSQLSPAISASVERVDIKMGEHVEENDLLLVLDDTELVFNLKKVQAQLLDIKSKIENKKVNHTTNLAALEKEKTLLALEKKGLERNKNLQKEEVMTQAQLEVTQKQVHQRELSVLQRKGLIDGYSSQLDQLSATKSQLMVSEEKMIHDLTKTRIKAPFSGKIAQVSVAAGDRVMPGQVLLRIIPTNGYEVRAQIPNQYLHQVMYAQSRGGISASFLINGKKYVLKLKRFSPEVKPSQVGIEGIFEFVDREINLSTNQPVLMSLKLPRLNNVYAMPIGAVYDQTYIFILSEDQRLQKLKIDRLGDIRYPGKEHKVLFTCEQLDVNDLVLMDQLTFAIEGLKVKAVKS